MADNMTQCEEILEWMQAGKTITALEALHEFGCFRLAARIHDLKEAGHDIVSEDYSYQNSKGQTKTIAMYSLAPVEERPWNEEQTGTQGDLL